MFSAYATGLLQYRVKFTEPRKRVLLCIDAGLADTEELVFLEFQKATA